MTERQFQMRASLPITRAADDGARHSERCDAEDKKGI
jgi:hypothetical protein